MCVCVLVFLFHLFCCDFPLHLPKVNTSVNLSKQFDSSEVDPLCYISQQFHFLVSWLKICDK